MKSVITLWLLYFIYFIRPIQSVTIEYPCSVHIQERIRNDFDSIDRIFRPYIVPREIQFHADPSLNQLSFFLQCKGSKDSIKLTIPPAASDYLSLDTNRSSFTVTAKLKKSRLHLALVGRYTCSETDNDKISETSIHVFIQDGPPIFTKTLYPEVLQNTGVHFVNIPCHTTNWFPKMSCSMVNHSTRYELRECISNERPLNEDKCNAPICNNQDICIPVYLIPGNLEPSKVFFDPQIGFALENPIISESLPEFQCVSTFARYQTSIVPYNNSDPDYIHIHQPSLSIMPDEIVRLSCEIQYGKAPGIQPNIYWFEDIYDLDLIENKTEEAVFNPHTQNYSRNSSITLRGFTANQDYRFYCVRLSDKGVYSRFIEIKCVDKPSLKLRIRSNGSSEHEYVRYGSNISYEIRVFTIPRSTIILEITRNGTSLLNDKRFQLTLMFNKENQTYKYMFTIFHATFEDETDIRINVKSSELEKLEILAPNVTGNPVSQLSFIPTQNPPGIAWRNEDHKSKLNIHSYGIYQNESYHVVCTIKHRSDIEKPLNVFIQRIECNIDNCLADIIDKSCRVTTGQRLSIIRENRGNFFRTQFTSSKMQSLNDTSIGYQYICCYEQNGLTVLAKGLTALANNRNMFFVEHHPDFGLVTGDVLTYRCAAHKLIYDDLRMIYSDGMVTYERNRSESEWYIFEKKQTRSVDVEWLTSISENIRDISIQIKTLQYNRTGHKGYLQCIALPKRPDVIQTMNDTYIINVEMFVPLEFKSKLPSVVHIDEKPYTNITLDCSYNGRPMPKMSWFKGKLSLASNDTTLQLRDNNGSIHITRAQASDTGYYTCELFNGRGTILRRSFDLRIIEPSNHPTDQRIILITIIVSGCLILLLLVLLIIIAVKYFKMKKIVDKSIFHPAQPTEPEDKTQPPMAQLPRLPLPDNFASTPQIRTLFGYVNGDMTPTIKDDFKELGRGQFGVVYQVRLPDVGLVAAKLLPDSIRNVEHRRDKRKKSDDIEESQEMIAKQHENKKKKAAEMLIDEIKVMYKAGKHVNIVSLLKVAYPEAKFRYILTGGPIRDEDSFYLMELCSNGSLESMLKRFQHQSTNASNKLSLYQTLSKSSENGLTIDQAYDLCILTEDDLILIAYQVASGVDYLNRIQIAHCDIAARNVLVNSRFIMKICDFGLATWTTYKNYREQLAQNESVQLEKKNNELATHNLTPELARAILRASTPDERLLLNKSSIKSDVWSFGILLWTLFLKCRFKPFDNILSEVRGKSGGSTFFHRLARIVSDGRVLDYIDYRPEIPEAHYGIICLCLREENERPEMSTIRGYLCYENMLSKQAFKYYRTEYDRYLEEKTGGNFVRFGETQGTHDSTSYTNKQKINISDEVIPLIQQNDTNQSDIPERKIQSNKSKRPVSLTKTKKSSSNDTYI